jgi:hypothetical protein
VHKNYGSGFLKLLYIIANIFLREQFPIGKSRKRDCWGYWQQSAAFAPAADSADICQSVFSPPMTACQLSFECFGPANHNSPFDLE